MARRVHLELPIILACCLPCPGDFWIPQKGYRRLSNNRLCPDRALEHLDAVQRLFFMFPAGLPGIALLLLRVSVAIAPFVEGYGHRQDLSGWIQLAAVLLALTLCAGFLTPIGAVLELVTDMLIWFRFGFASATVASRICLDSLALAFLGPGAYSVDSVRFGRRVVVLPPP